MDDHPVVLRGLRSICAEDPEIEIIGEAETSLEAIKATGELEPDVAIVPLRLGGSRTGIEVCRTLWESGGTRTVVFTSYARQVDIQIAALAGANALVSKFARPEELLLAVHRAAAGEKTFIGTESGIDRGEVSQALLSGSLTRREQEVLTHVLEGMTNVEISERLVIGTSTVKTHMRAILRKFGVGNRRELL